MAYQLLSAFPVQLEDANGNPLSGGSLEFYIWNTSTPVALYSDDTGTSLGTSCTLNSLGKPRNSGGTAVQLFGDTEQTEGYKIIVKDADGAVIPPTLGRITTSVLLSDLTNATDPDLGVHLVGGAARIGDFTSAEFGGVGDGATNNDAAFVLAEASDYLWIWMPEGTYELDTYTKDQFTKNYFGPGRFRTSDGNLRGNWVHSLTETLTAKGNTSDENLWFNGDWSHCLIPVEQVITVPPITTGPFNQDGASLSGDTILYIQGGVPSWVGYTVNNFFALDVKGYGIPADTKVKSITGTYIELTNATTQNRPHGEGLTVGTGQYLQPFEICPINVSIFAKEDTVSAPMDSIGAGGIVTHAFNANIKNDSGGGGIGGFHALINVAREFADYDPAYPFNTAAGWLMSGKVSANAANTYLTGIEYEVNDNAHNSCAIGFVLDFARQSAGAGAQHFWTGMLFNYGACTEPADRWIGGGGPSKIGIDFTSGDFTSHGNAAVTMVADQKVYFNSTASSSTAGAVGSEFITYNSSAAKMVMQVGAVTASTFQWSSDGGFWIIPTAGYITIGATQVVGARVTGFTAGTGTQNKGAFAADTATAVQAAQRVLALEIAMRAHGLIN